MQELATTFLSFLNEMSPYLLLGFFIAGLLHSFVPSKIYSKHLAKNNMASVIKAAILGIPLPLCSCGVLPTAVSLRNNGASKASATSFLIATPQTGVDSISATYSLLGPAFAIIRPVAALVTSIFGGWVVTKIDQDADNSPADDTNNTLPTAVQKNGFFSRLAEAFKYGFWDMVKSIGKWLIIGLVIATAISCFVPDDFFSKFAQYPLLNMLLVLAISVPMYVCATGSIPIALSLMLKGLTPGAALVLLMAGPAANFASVLVINKSFGKKATAAYVASIVIGAMAFGLIIDYLLPQEWFSPFSSGIHTCEHGSGNTGIFATTCSAILATLLVVSHISTIIRNRKTRNNISTMTKEYKIEGMTCTHCQANVEKGINAIDGVEKVSVDLTKGIAYVDGAAAPETIIKTVTSLGYECKEIGT